MVWVNSKSFWIFLPALADVFIRGESFERVEPLREIIGHQEGLQMLFQVVMGRIGNPNTLFRPAPLAARLRRRSPFACGACRAPRSAPEPGGGTVQHGFGWCWTGAAGGRRVGPLGLLEGWGAISNGTDNHIEGSSSERYSWVVDTM
jgi:hypothetical protein